MGPTVLSYAEPRPPPRRPTNWLTRAGLGLCGCGWAAVFGGSSLDRSHPWASGWVMAGGAVSLLLAMFVGLMAIVTGPGRRRAVAAVAIQAVPYATVLLLA